MSAVKKKLVVTLAVVALSLLEEVVLAARRRQHADRLSTLRDLDLADPEVMAGAWR